MIIWKHVIFKSLPFTCFICHNHGNIARNFPQNIPDTQEPLVVLEPPHQVQTHIGGATTKEQVLAGNEKVDEVLGNQTFSGFEADFAHQQAVGLGDTHNNYFPVATPTHSDLKQIITPLNPRRRPIKSLSPSLCSDLTPFVGFLIALISLLNS